MISSQMICFLITAAKMSSTALVLPQAHTLDRATRDYPLLGNRCTLRHCLEQQTLSLTWVGQAGPSRSRPRMSLRL